ncbi:MAG: hypothetical protein QOG53_3536 [Frankiales bacterium]|nr:hypothetical protein [Frankiales bacterium]
MNKAVVSVFTHAEQGTKPRFWRIGVRMAFPAAVLGIVFVFATGSDAVSPTTYVVNVDTDTDDGVCDHDCTLREAINAANAHSGADVITFAIDTGSQTIAPTSALPTITGPVTIDGTTQPGWVDAPIIELNGASAGAANGLSVSAGNSTIRGLVINRFNAVGVSLSGGNNKVEGNYIGTDAAGTTALGNVGPGVDITGTDDVVGGTASGAGNVISGNEDGIAAYYTSGTRVEGNYIGTDVTGTLDLGNTLRGVAIYDAPDSTIGGTVAGARNIISGNQYSGIEFFTSANDTKVEGNYIGTDVTGTLDLGNNVSGVALDSGADVTVGGTVAGARNVISGNSAHGIEISGGVSGTKIEGNYIGADATGTVGIPNSSYGVSINQAADNVVGGTVAGTRNIISGNGGFRGSGGGGVHIFGAASSGNRIEGNYIGTDVTGTIGLDGIFGIGVYIEKAPSNTVGGAVAGARNVISGNQTGLYIWGFGTGASGNQVQGNYIGTDVTGSVAIGNYLGVGISHAATNTIGGTTAGARNVISGNNNSGIIIAEATSTGNKVEGNYIGTDATGTVALGNNVLGVIMNNAPNNTVGGSVPGALNVISNNRSGGVSVGGPFANGNTIQGNYIGTDATGTVDFGNAVGGVQFFSTYDTEYITSGAVIGNTIAFNDGSGIAAYHAKNIAMSRNRIHSNAGLGIDHDYNGPSINDPGDADGGANNTQNYPVLTSDAPVVEGTLDSTPNTAFTVELFSNSACDPTGSGEGATFEESIAVTTNSSGQASFSATLSGIITATATDPAGNTSEFSVCSPQPVVEFVVNSDADTPDETPYDGTCDDGFDACTLRAAIEQSNATPVHETITFAIDTGQQKIKPESALPALSNPVTIDGTTQPGYGGEPLIELTGGNAGALVDGLQVTAGHTTVRGLLVNSFGGNGIKVSGASGNTIELNYLGTNEAGTGSAPNGRNGVRIGNSADNLISGNVISGNAQHGVQIDGSATGNRVQGNLIGTDSSGAVSVGNTLEGVLVSNGASNNTIGSVEPADANTIAHNGDRGVQVTVGTGNDIASNAIFANGALGIDLSPAGVTPNDAGDADVGANMRQNWPVVTAAYVLGTNTQIQGTLSSKKSTTFRVDVFASPGCDSSGRGEGKLFLGATEVTTNSSGTGSFSLSAATVVPAGQVITATATDPGGNTSEFSACAALTAAPSISIGDSSVNEGNASSTTATFTLTRTGTTTGSSSVKFVTAQGTAKFTTDFDVKWGTVTFAPNQTTAAVTVKILGDLIDEANENFRVVLYEPVNADIGDDSGQGIIVDNDPPPTLSINDKTITEGTGSDTIMTFTVTLSAASGRQVTVQFATANGSAVAPSDYVARPLTTLTFTAGQTTKTVSVTVKADSLAEPDEDLFVNLSTPVNATLADAQGKGTITNDD